MADDTDPPKPNRYSSLLRLLLFLLAIAALIATAWWFLYDIEHYDIPPAPLGPFT